MFAKGTQICRYFFFGGFVGDLRITEFLQVPFKNILYRKYCFVLMLLVYYNVYFINFYKKTLCIYMDVILVTVIFRVIGVLMNSLFLCNFPRYYWATVTLCCFTLISVCECVCVFSWKLYVLIHVRCILRPECMGFCFCLAHLSIWM